MSLFTPLSGLIGGGLIGTFHVPCAQYVSFFELESTIGSSAFLFLIPVSYFVILAFVRRWQEDRLVFCYC